MHKALWEVAAVFFKMGWVAFGGPAAHIAMMEAELIEKRQWMSQEKFLDLIGLTHLIPGPNSTEMTMHCGYVRAGWAGLFVAGICFISPAVLLTGLLAYLYVSYGQLPEIAPWLLGIKPAVLALIASAILKLGKKALKNIELGVLGGAVLLAALLGVHEVLTLLAAGLIGLLYFTAQAKLIPNKKNILPILLFQLPTVALKSVGSWTIFWTFLKVGAVLYGSGYVLFAYLDAELVTKGWLSRAALMDAIAVGQFTPGPVLSTATFVGYQLGAAWGAVAATLGIFLPSFCFVLLLHPLIPQLRRSKTLRFFLDSVNIAAVAIMLAVLVNMSIECLIDWQSILIAGFSVFISFRVKQINAMGLVLMAALLGFLLHLF